MLRGFVKTVLVWYAFFPYVALLRLIGPWAASVVGRGICWIHWLFLLVRGGGPISRTMTRLAPHFAPHMSIATLLRRHLETKHQFFVEWNVYPTMRGRRFVARTYQPIRGREHLDAALQRGRGAIILSHHFGMFRMAMPALQEAGYHTSTLVMRGADYAGQAHHLVVQAVLRRKVAVEGASELGVIYHRRGTAFTRMTAILQHNGVLGIAADGLTGSHFVDVPYLGGRVAWPTGPAWLSLRSGAPILLVLSLLEGLARHRITLLPPLYCQGRSRAAVADLVRAYAALLDEYTRRYPWAWWPWRRLDVRPDADGVLWLQVGERPEEKQGHYTPELEAQPEPI